ncbi:MAG: hypothetical protein Q8K00_00485 [Syntrophales bacterium]|nr:hypothetical protein [Syntrophales bacterium]
MMLPKLNKIDLREVMADFLNGHAGVTVTMGLAQANGTDSFRLHMTPDTTLLRWMIAISRFGLTGRSWTYRNHQGGNVTDRRSNVSRQMEQRICEIEKYGMKAKGRKELVYHLEGRPLPRGKAILGMCYSCSGFYADGKIDCAMPMCPLYRYMPYRGKADD